MHLALKILLGWYLVGSLIPTAMLAYSLWGGGGKATRRRRLALAFLVGPPCWLVLWSACLIGVVMWLAHKVRGGGSLVPPGSPPPGGEKA